MIAGSAQKAATSDRIYAQAVITPAGSTAEE
jgi:hypothetical protein